MKWPKTSLTERLHIRYPIIQAPMAGGLATPQLVAAVSNAGGLGSLGAGYMEPEEIRSTIREIRTLTDKPFAVNLLIPEPVTEDAEIIEYAYALLEPYYQELGLPTDDSSAANLTNLPNLHNAPNFKEQLAVAVEEKANALSFTFGAPNEKEIEALKEWGIPIIGTATHLLEAIVLEESGIDIVVAQGAEAGGHRGTFIGHYEQCLVGIMALIPVLVDHLSIPVVAAGGIMDGRGIVASLALGAAGVQMGTAFLACPENGTRPNYKAALQTGTEIATVLTRVFSGKFARGLHNRFIDELLENETDLPGYPIQNALTRNIRRAAAEQDRPEFMPLWAGQGCSLGADRPAGELIRAWVAQAEAIIRGDR